MKKIALFIVLVFLAGCSSQSPMGMRELFRIKYKNRNEMSYSGRIFQFSQDYIALTTPNKYCLYNLDGKKLWEFSAGEKTYGEMAGNESSHIVDFNRTDPRKSPGILCYLDKKGKVLWQKEVEAYPTISWDGKKVLFQIAADTEYDGFILMDSAGEELTINKEILKNEVITYLSNTGKLIVLASLPGEGGNIRKIIFCTNERILSEHPIKGEEGYDYLDVKIVFDNSFDDHFVAIFNDGSRIFEDGKIINHVYSFNEGNIIWQSDQYSIDEGEKYACPLSDDGKFFSLFDRSTKSLILLDNLTGKEKYRKQFNEFDKDSTVSLNEISPSGKYVLLIVTHKFRDQNMKFQQMYIVNEKGQIIYQKKLDTDIFRGAFSRDDKYLYVADDTYVYNYDISEILK